MYCRLRRASPPCSFLNVNKPSRCSLITQHLNSFQVIRFRSLNQLFIHVMLFLSLFALLLFSATSLFSTLSESICRPVIVPARDIRTILKVLAN